jgi:APA family basic amino acid/polyamine antiporter
VSIPVRRVDAVAGGVAASFGAGLFLGLAPAASLAGRWLLVAFLGAAVVGSVAVLSTSDRPIETLPLRLRRFGFVLGTVGRLAAAVAIAGTVATYLTPLAALGVVVAATAAAAVGLPPVVTRVATVVVLGVLLVVVVACFAIAPAAPPVAADDGGSPLGVLAAAGLLSVCFFGVERGAGGRRGVVVVLGVVAIGCLAVAGAALHQVGAPRLAISPAPLRAVLAAADASAVEPLLLVGLVVGCGFALLGVLRGLRVSGVPRVRLAVAGGAATAFGALLVPPTAALAAAAVLLLGDAVFRAIAVRHRPVDS